MVHTDKSKFEKKEMKPRFLGISPEGTLENYYTGSVKLSVELMNGHTIAGRIIGIDMFNILLQKKDNSVVFITKHSIVTIEAIKED